MTDDEFKKALAKKLPVWCNGKISFVIDSYMAAGDKLMAVVSKTPTAAVGNNVPVESLSFEKQEVPHA